LTADDLILTDPHLSATEDNRMSLGRKPQQTQKQFWIEVDSLPDVPRHVFYDKLNELLAQGDFDRWIEKICAPFYAKKLGRPGIPPGIYFRMLFIGYFEGIDSQRGIASRCADSRSLAGSRVSGANSFRRNGASWPNAASPTSARRAVRDGSGNTRSRRSTSVTRWRRRREIWD
jgi:hypothetical protein